jgi:hypothetical protein
MKEINDYKPNLLFKTMKSLTNITPDKDQILKIEDLRMDFKNLSAKIINLGIDEKYLNEAVKSLELGLFWSLKSMLVNDYEDMRNENE